MNPLKKIGKTPDGRAVLAGSFQMADTHGFPLADSFIQARERNAVISIPHYFASAMEHGWDDEQAFSALEIALRDSQSPLKIEEAKAMCIHLFMDTAADIDSSNALEIGRAMREKLEKV